MQRSTGRSRFFDEGSHHVDRFGLLLALVVIAVFALALVDLDAGDDPVGRWASLATVSVFVGAVLLLSVRASGVARRWRRPVDAFVISGFAISAVALILAVVSDGDSLPSASVRGPSPIWLLLTALAPVLVVRRVLRHSRVTAATLLGAISAYLLLPITFFFVFLAIDAVQDVPFFGVAEPTTTFMYFSLVTVTTLGFGDVSAATEIGRVFTTMLAVIGQVYMVTFVAMIVGLYAQHRVAPGDDD